MPWHVGHSSVETLPGAQQLCLPAGHSAEPAGHPSLLTYALPPPPPDRAHASPTRQKGKQRSQSHARQQMEMAQVLDRLERLSEELVDARASAERQQHQIDEMLIEHAQTRQQLAEAKKHCDDTMIELALVKEKAEVAAERLEELQNKLQ